MMENNFRLFFERYTDTIVIFNKETHLFLDCNPAMLEKYGYTKKECASNPQANPDC